MAYCRSSRRRALIFLGQQADVVVFADNFVDDAAAADRGVIVAGDFFDQASHFIGGADASHRAVDARAERGDAVVRLPAELVEFEGVDGLALVLRFLDLAQAVIAVFDPVVDAVGTVRELRWDTCATIVAVGVDHGPQQVAAGDVLLPVACTPHEDRHYIHFAKGIGP